MAEATASGGPADAPLRLVLAQLDFTVGAIGANVEKIVQACERARDEYGADLVVFPELALTGYPPEDLLLNPSLHLRVLHGLEELKRRVRGVAAVFGYPHHATGGYFNSASVLADGKLIATCHKQHLPNYGVFDEQRYFSSGEGHAIVEVRGVPLGITICEDLWSPGPIAAAAAAGARAVVNLNASPYHLGKRLEREAVVRQRIEESGLPLVYLNLVGGQDELVFDGESFAMDAQGRVTHRFPAFTEGLYPLDLEPQADGRLVPLAGDTSTPSEDAESVYQALVCGVRDYVGKNGFDGVVIGLSGGIDSAVTLAVAVDALGPERVEAVMMPSRYTAGMSVEDASAQAQTLGVDYRVLPIEPAFQAFLGILEEEFAGRAPDTSEENIQARCRGVILMAIANKKRRIVLTTGNKSEMAVGYATLYGDMAGGYSALKDVPKTLVYRLAEYRNGLAPVIPQRVIERPPSAELAPNQQDTDSLPPYPVLDAVLELYVEQDKSIREIIAAGYEEALVRRVVQMVDRNEYKRRQAPPGVRVTRRAFGRDRRYPITSGFGRDRYGEEV